MKKWDMFSDCNVDASCFCSFRNVYAIRVWHFENEIAERAASTPRYLFSSKFLVGSLLTFNGEPQLCEEQSSGSFRASEFGDR